MLSFHHNFKALQKGIERYNRKELDQITIYEKKCIELKEFLRNQLVVGYVSDYDDNSDEDGIYVLEDQVLVTQSGRKVLSHAPWELQA